MRAVVSVMLVLVSAVGCVIPSRTLRPDEVIKASNTEAYVVVIADVPDTYTVSGYLCQDGDLGRCVTVGPQRTTDGLQVYAMPPGNYCLTQLLLQNGMASLDMQLDRKHYKCFAVDAGAVAYPGHLDVEVTPTQFSSSAARYRFVVVSGVREQVHAAYPTLAQVEFVTPLVGPAPR